MPTTRQIIIIGGGPAGYTAAIYAARANLAPLVLAGTQAGGQLVLTTLVENYPGFVDDVTGPVLVETMRKQAERFGAEIVERDVTGVDFRRRPFVVRDGDTIHEGESVVIASGASARLLGLPDERALLGRGVSTCATCDGFFFKDQRVVVVGGGDSAMEEALYLSRLASHVTVVHRRDTLRASQIMQERARKNPRIEFAWNSDVVAISDPAQGRVRAVTLRDVRTGERSERPADGVFVAIGHEPNTALFRGQVELLADGYVRVAPGTTRTSVPGVFAAGDVQDRVYRQAVTAAATGCMAALDAERWLEGSAP